MKYPILLATLAGSFWGLGISYPAETCGVARDYTTFVGWAIPHLRITWSTFTILELSVSSHNYALENLRFFALNRTMRLSLLVEESRSTEGVLEVSGRYWKLMDFEIDDEMDTDDLEFSCISYTWGLGREPHPFRPNIEVSDRTIPALQAFMYQYPICERIWIDAFCVPPEGKERAYILESMGYIYSKAKEVVAVLSNTTLPVLEHMIASDRIDTDDLQILEGDEWVSRAWTYQETVNSKMLYFTCEEALDVSVPASKFLNCVGYSLTRLKCSVLEKLQKYPRLSVFEDVIADYYTAEYEGRSALQVMSNMDRRSQLRPEDHFYAMIGAISTVRASSVGNLEPCEAFMRLCEKKGDFSFIYSAAIRDHRPLRRWRPVLGDLPSILPWHGWGAGQNGHLDDDGLLLDDMLVVHSAPPQEMASQFVQQWVTSFFENHQNSKQNPEEAAYAALQIMGFKGSSQCLTTAEGYFFPFETVTSEQVIQFLISAALRWVCGAPGLVSFEKEVGKGISYTPGVYIGEIDPKAATSIKLS